MAVIKRFRLLHRFVLPPHLQQPDSVHTFAAENFKALVVAISGASGGIDLAEQAAFRANRDRSRINIPRLLHDRTGHATAARVQRLCFVAENPAKRLELGDQHVLEDSTRALLVVQRWRPGSRLVMTSISGSPMSPRSIRALSAAYVGSKRRWKPIMRVTPLRRTASVQSRDGQIDGPSAEHGLASIGRCENGVGVCIRAGSNDDRVDSRIAVCLHNVHGQGAVFARKGFG